MSELLVVDLGTLSYAAALDLQRDVARRRISGEIAEDVLLLVEHPPVVTLGRTAKGANLIASPELLATQGVELFEVERGGDITFHGPGQLVGYPIFDLKRHRQDLHWYLRQVEEALILTLKEFEIEAGRVEKYTGVWVNLPGTANGEPGTEALYRDDCDSSTAPLRGSARNDTQFGSPFPVPRSQSSIPDSRRKIASIGVHARDWVTWHGFALNVNTELRYFDLIIPCGITGVTMTSVARELQVGSVDMRTARDAAGRAFGATFDLTVRMVDATELGVSTPVGTPAESFR